MPENLNDPIQVDVNSIYDLTLGIITHLHSYERWLGAIAVPTSTRFADETETSFQVDSGNADWGAWVQILGTDDTPVVSGKVYSDLHRLLITDNEQATTYRLQLAFGADGDTAYAAGDYTEVAIKFPVGAVQPTPIEVQGERHLAGTECWARCRCSSNTGTLDFMIGLHEYDA